MEVRLVIQTVLRAFPLTLCLSAAAWAGGNFDVFITTNGPLAGPATAALGKFSSDGTFIDSLPLTIQQAPNTIITDGVDVFVGQTAAVGNSQINKYTTGGQFIEAAAVLPTPFIPFRLETDPSGNFYVVDLEPGIMGETNVYRFDSDGNLNLTISGTEARGVEADADGTIYVSARDELRVYDATGVLQDTVPTPFFFGSDMSIDNESDILYMADEPGEIGVFDISGPSAILTDTLTIPSIKTFAIGIHHSPINGNLFVADLGQGIEMTTTGDLVQLYADDDVFFNTDIVTVVPEPNSDLLAAVSLIAFWLRRSN